VILLGNNAEMGRFWIYCPQNVHTVFQYIHCRFCSFVFLMTRIFRKQFGGRNQNSIQEGEMMKTTKSNGEVNLTIIGEGMEITGELNTSDDIRIDGVFKGELETKGKVVISPKGYLEGNVRGNTISVNGKGKGDFHAAHNFEVVSNGGFSGTVKTKFINILETAVFEGTCFISQNNSSLLDRHGGNGFFGREQQRSREVSSEMKKVRKERKEKKVPEGEKEPAANINGKKVASVVEKEDAPDGTEKKGKTLINNKISQLKSL